MLLLLRGVILIAVRTRESFRMGGYLEEFLAENPVIFVLALLVRCIIAAGRCVPLILFDTPTQLSDVRFSHRVRIA